MYVGLLNMYAGSLPSCRHDSELPQSGYQFDESEADGLEKISTEEKDVTVVLMGWFVANEVEWIESVELFEKKRAATGSFMQKAPMVWSSMDGRSIA